MPPKKKKPTPIVVGTVSTRSTRRESIVNIEIIPKASKSAVRTSLPKRLSKKPSKIPDEIEQKISGESPEKASSEILDILKDWSDDENSQDDSMFSISSNTQNLIIDKTYNRPSLPVDQQSLIDILEGNQLEPNQSKSIKETVEHVRNQEPSPKLIKFAFAKDLLIENPILNINSPQMEETEIIEECVVEDDSIIIELGEEQVKVVTHYSTNEGQNEDLNVSVEDISTVDNKLGSPVVATRSKNLMQLSGLDCDFDNYEQGSRSPINNMGIIKSTCVSNKNHHQLDMNQDKNSRKQKDISNIFPDSKQSTNNGIDEDNQSMTSEDTTSQSMITVQDEDALDINDIHMSDNSTTNYEIIEEQVVFDTSEPIIIENLVNVHSDVEIQKSDLLENNEFNTSLENSDLSLNSLDNPNKSMLQDVSTRAIELPNKGGIKVNEPSDVKGNDKLLKYYQVKSSYEDLPVDVPKGLKEKDILQSTSDLSVPYSDQKISVNLENVNIEDYNEKSTEIVTDNKVEAEVISYCKDDGTSTSVYTIPLTFNKNTQNSSNKISKLSESSEKDAQKSIYFTNLEFNKDTSRSNSQGEYICLSKMQLQETKTESLHPQSEEHALCQKINESMQISKQSSTIKYLDPVSEKLQEGIQKMHIEEEGDQSEPVFGGSRNYENVRIAGNMEVLNNKGSSLRDTGHFAKEIEQEGLQLKSIEEKQRGKKVISKGTPEPTKKGKSLMESDIEKFPDKINTTEIDINQRRRSTRKKSRWDQPHILEVAKEEAINLKNISEQGTTDSHTNSSFQLRGKKVQKKEDVERHSTDNDSKMISDVELDLNKDVKSPKSLKGKSRRMLEKQTAEAIRMDIDSESSEAKTSEAEGDSTSNESNQGSSTNKIYKTRATKILKKQIEEFNKMDIETMLESKHPILEMNKSEHDMDITTDENNQNKKSKGIKTKAKRVMKKVKDDEMAKTDNDIGISQNYSDIKILPPDIDATIDDVLRKYAQDELDTAEESTSPKELKSKMAKPTKELKRKKDIKPRKDERYEISEEVRRSDRIKTILPVKKKSHGLVRSKSEPALSVEAENSDTNLVHSELDKPIRSISPQLNKKYKPKSRAKSSENLQISNSGSLLSDNSPQLPKAIDLKTDKSGQAEIETRLKSFIHLKENQYKTDRQICKEAREMICDCYLAEEDIQKDEYGCGEDCLNRLLMIECGYLCQIGDRCTNKRFQKGQVAPAEVFKTDKKGLGLIAAANIPYGEFILEYIGEVLNPDEFDKRAEVYSKDKNIHFYFMSLRADAIIDATMKGNISRFINHSCDPNAETQKWTVNGELRIGFFSTRTILAGEEITFDYKFQRYGKEAQKCYCEATTCRGWLGERPDESEDEEEEEEEEHLKEERTAKAEVKVPTPEILIGRDIREKEINQEKISEKSETDVKAEVTVEVKLPEETPALLQIQDTPKKVLKKKLRKELLYEDFDQLNEDIEMVVTTGLKNQAHTLKLSRLMVRAKDLDQRKKLLRVLRRGELPCRRLFLDYHGLRLMHGYMIDAQQLTNGDKKSTSQLEFLQTKLELLQTLAVLPIQNKTMLIESKVLPAVEKWAKNEDLVEDSSDFKDGKKSPEAIKQEVSLDPAVNEKIDEIKFLASKLLEEWVNMKESFRIPKKQRIEQMKEHEKEANRKFVENSHAQEKESSRKSDQRYRSWSRYKSERETNKKGHRPEDKPSAEYLKISKHERRKLFALQMELKEEERRLKQREMWRQHEMNCMMIGADPRFTAPFDPSKGFQYIWNPSIGQWQALPVPSVQNQGVYNSPVTPQGAAGFNVPPTSQGVSSYNVPPSHKPSLISPYQSSMLNVPGMPGSAQQYPGMQPNIAPMVPGLTSSVSTITSTVPGMTASLPGITASLPAITAPIPGLTAPLPGMTSLVSGITGSVHGISGPAPVITGSVPGISQPPLPVLPIYQEIKQMDEDPSQVKFAGPIPPPVKLPPKWKCAKDKYGRPYYYHVKLRKSQWEPPPVPEEVEEFSDTSSSETTSLSSSDTSSDSETEDEIDDTKLLMEVRKQMESTSKITLKSVIPQHVKKEEKDSATPSPEVKMESDNEDEPTEELKEEMEEENSEQLSSIDIRLKEQFNLDSADPPKKKRRIGLCQEIIISPRTEEDRQQFKEDLKRYKATKEKLKRQKDQMVHQAKKKLKAGSSGDDTKRSRDKRVPKGTAKSRMKQMSEWNDEHAKKIKEVFRSTMATTVVGVLNAYRKPDCKESRITNTEDFKHLARKLTHFVMLKEIKHINTIDELICTDNVKAKAREYIKKYMSKFGEVYQKRQDEPDFKD